MRVYTQAHEGFQCHSLGYRLQNLFLVLTESATFKSAISNYERTYITTSLTTAA